MKTDLLASELINNLSKEADTLYEQCHTTLSTLIDAHAPQHTKHTSAVSRQEILESIRQN